MHHYEFSLYLCVPDCYEDVLKELLYLLVEECGGVDGQLSKNEHLCTYTEGQQTASQ